MQPSTKKSTRIIIWIIAIVMAAGSLTAYFAIILQNNQAQQQETPIDVNEPQKEQQVDPTAHKIEGRAQKLEITDLTVGQGQQVKAGDTIRVHYKGTLAQSGVKFDSSYDKGEPVTFELTGLIEGWQQGIPGMNEGGKRRLIVPAALGYGTQGYPPSIPADTDLVFEVEVLAIVPAESQEQGQ